MWLINWTTFSSKFYFLFALKEDMHNDTVLSVGLSVCLFKNDQENREK